jgi:DNA helicase HerA-like ATPase
MSILDNMPLFPKKYIPPIDCSNLPVPSDRSINVGHVAGFDQLKAVLDMDQLCKHLIIVGGGATGKTTAAKAIAAGCTSKGVQTIVFDPSGAWSGLCKQEARVSYDTPKQDVFGRGKDGNLSVYILKNLLQKDYNEFIQNALTEIDISGRDMSDRLETLIVFDDAYRLSPSFGGNGTLLLERGLREYRKYGIGVVLITHAFYRLGEVVLGNVDTEMWFNTGLEEDLAILSQKCGASFTEQVPQLGVGDCLVSCAEYNYGQPWFVSISAPDGSHA